MKTWSNEASAYGRSKMSACPNSTFVWPASRTRRSASAADSADRSTLVKRASGLLAASVTVCAPTPQPASSTRSPGA